MFVYNMLIKHDFLETSCKEEIQLMDSWNEGSTQDEWSNNNNARREIKKGSFKSRFRLIQKIKLKRTTETKKKTQKKELKKRLSTQAALFKAVTEVRIKGPDTTTNTLLSTTKEKTAKIKRTANTSTRIKAVRVVGSEVMCTSSSRTKISRNKTMKMNMKNTDQRKFKKTTIRVFKRTNSSAMP